MNRWQQGLFSPEHLSRVKLSNCPPHSESQSRSKNLIMTFRTSTSTSEVLNLESAACPGSSWRLLHPKSSSPVLQSTCHSTKVGKGLHLVSWPLVRIVQCQPGSPEGCLDETFFTQNCQNLPSSNRLGREEDVQWLRRRHSFLVKNQARLVLLCHDASNTGSNVF